MFLSREETCRSADWSEYSDVVHHSLVERTKQLALLNQELHKQMAERQRVEEALREAEAKYRSIFENAVEGIFQTTPEGGYLSANPALARLCGYDSPTDLIENLTDIQHQLYVDPNRRAEFVAALEQADSVTRFESQVYRKDGDVIWILENARAVRDANGKTLYYEGTVEDITDRKNAEETLRQSEARLREQALQLEQALCQLQQTQAQIVQAEKMSSLGQLVAGVAHEINNPINFIHGNLTHATNYVRDLLDLLTLFQQECGPLSPAIEQRMQEIDLEFLVDDLPKLLSSMHLGTDRIRQIVLSLRNFSRLDEAEMKPVNLHEGLDNTLLILQNRLKPNASFPGVQIVKAYGQLPLVDCYAGQLNQVFMNILTNAIDALEETYASNLLQQPVDCSGRPVSAAGEVSYATMNRQNRSIDTQNLPTITIRTELRGHCVQIHITDNGPGIPEVVRQKLFDPFFTTKPVGKGTGLGLSISYDIVVKKHDGRLECQSLIGQGTEFLVEIPLRRQAEG